MAVRFVSSVGIGGGGGGTGTVGSFGAGGRAVVRRSRVRGRTPVTATGRTTVGRTAVGRGVAGTLSTEREANAGR
jgi:hypothetical protein